MGSKDTKDAKSVVKIRDIEVKFPYEKPYDIQVTYMEKVIECLEEKRHGVLESPTGTGKTLCLFAPVTSWLRSKKPVNQATRCQNDNEIKNWGRRQRVWYTARTHSQIAQTVAEVRRCDIEGLNIRVLGARDQLCIHPAVSNEKESHIKTAKCKELVKTRSCRFYKNLDYPKVAPHIYHPGEVLDIEDLAKAGRSCGVCPYFLAVTARDSADVVLMPYNYIIDRESRGNTGAAGQNDIVIFDEGHNVPNTCEESYEFAITSVDLALGVRNIQDLMESLANQHQYDVGSEEDVDIATHAAHSMQILELMKRLEAGFSSIPASSQLYPLPQLYSLFESAGVTKTTAVEYMTIIDLFNSESHRLQLNGPMLTTFNHLTKMLETLFGKAINEFTPEMIEKSFKFAMAPDFIENSKKLSLFCFNPSFGIKDVLLLGVQSLIITSGTLSPLRNFVFELGLSNPVTLENGHIASKSQVPFMILGTGVNNVKMDASFKNRKDPAYMYSLGMTLTNLISSVPDGVLLLFSSYSMMQSLKENWESQGGVWNRLNSLKRVFIEPRGKDEFINCMENFRRAIDSGNGALLMGVLRGKVSEGMDFKDQYCRAVFVVGVPFPPVTDPRVKGKENYSNTLMIENPTSKRNEKLYESFNSVEAMKATNQAIGRVIRHGGDYGAIVLVDYRFAWPRLFGNISKWLRGDAPQDVNFMVAKKTIREFFKCVHSGQLGIPEIRCQNVNAMGDPIAESKQYEVYDHRKAVNQVPAPWLASTSADAFLSKVKEEYDSDPPSQIEPKESILSKYKKKSSSSSLRGSQKPIPNLSGSFLDALDSADAGTSYKSEYTAYREVNIAALNSEMKRKKEETSPSLVFSQKKKSRQSRLAVDQAVHVPEPEPEPVSSTRGAIKTEILNYIQKTRKALPSNEASRFKETSLKYIKGETSLIDTITELQHLLLGSPPDYQHLMGFSCCVKPRDRQKWEELSRNWI